MKNKDLNQASVETKASKTKKGLKQLGFISLAVLLMIVGFAWGMNTTKPLKLDGLVDGVEYQVLTIDQDSEEETRIELKTEAEEAEVVEVVKAVVREVKEDSSYQEGQVIRVEVYNDKIESADQDSNDKIETTDKESKPLDDESHDYTAVYEETLKVYQLIDISAVEPNILATNNWTIEDSKYTEGHLTGQVNLMTESEVNVIASQLKAITSEMKRFNEVGEDKHLYFYTGQFNQMRYGYSTVFPNHLIVEKEYIVMTPTSAQK